MQRERFVRSFDDTELFVSTSGEGVPLVLCDGLGCDGFIWRHLVPAFEGRYRIVRWHYRGHGLSKPPVRDEELHIEALRKDLLAVLDALEIDRAVVMGHSLGCQVVLEFGLEHADRTLGVVPMCGSYGRPLDTFHDNKLLATTFPLLRDTILRYPDKAQRIWRRLVGSELAYQIAVNLEVNGKLVRRGDFWPYFQHLSAMDPGIFVRLLDGASSHTLEERLPDLEPPVLVIAGERDSFTPVWLSERMSELIPDCELLVVPGGTHVAPIEIPELVHLRLERFLSGPVKQRAQGDAPVTAPAETRSAPAKPARKRAAAKQAQAPQAPRTVPKAAQKKARRTKKRA